MFDGPIAYQEVFEIEMPDKTVKKLRTVVRQCDIKVNPGEILMKSVIDIYDADKKVDLKAPIIKQDLELKKQVEELEKLAQETKKARKKRERLEKKNNKG